MKALQSCCYFAEVAARLLVDGRQRLSSNVAADVVRGGFEAV